jgi:2,4-dienoyl-CoA reductase-like NADH-dependent reductase (Old Yellow Enzyme family)
MSLLFTPLRFKSITLKNRIVISPMCQYSATDGFANDWHLVHLGSRAVGGAALVIQEATAITPEGRISYGDLGIWKDEHIAPLQRITKFIEANGAVPGIQLAHAGRKASCEVPWLGGGQIKEGPHHWQTVAASAIPFYETDHTPQALSTPEIKATVQAFKEAAQRALLAGYKVVEIHAAHGYLINQFLSPLSNQRTDEYGGSFENRIRFLSEIVAAVQTVWPVDLPIFVRISASEWVEGGWTIEDSVQLTRILKTKAIDLVDCSSGGNAPAAKIPAGPGYQVPFAAAIKQQADIPTGAVGIITNAEQAEAILQAGEADLVFIARESLRDPHFPFHAAKALGDDIAWPDQYVRAKR